MAADERPKWLPKGWTAVSKTTRSGATLWFFYDPDAGSSFCSKKEVLEHLKAGKICSHSMRETRSTTRRSMENNTEPTNSANNKMDSMINVQDQIIDAPHELPQGWIKEMRLRKTGLRSDPFYIDPVSGYEFRSMKDVYRYIETGDVDKCANKPRKRSLVESNALEVKSQISATKGVDSGGSGVEKCLFSGGTDNLDVKMGKQINSSPWESQLRADNASSIQDAEFSSMMSVVTKNPDRPTEKETKAVVEHNSTCQEFKLSGDTLELGEEQAVEEPAIENPLANFGYCLSGSQNGAMHEPPVARQLNFSDEWPSKEPYKIQHGSDLQALNKSEATNLTLKEEEMELKKPKRTREQGSRKSRTFRTVTMPLRASPRLAALRAEAEAKSAVDGESCRPESKPLHDLEAQFSTQDHSTDSKPELNQPGTLSVDPEVSRKHEAEELPGEVGPAKDPVVLEGTRKDEPVSELTSIFGDSWLDPCIEFAFKTLIGDIPDLGNTVVAQDCPSQQQTSSARSQCPSNSDSMALHTTGHLNQADHLAKMEPQNSNMLSFGGNKRTCFVENGLQPTKNLEVRQWRS